MLPLIVTAAIVVKDGRLLITRRRSDAPYPLLWEFPGGKLEPEEDPRACLARELREELGIEVTVGEVFDVVYHRYPERPVLVLAYYCNWCGGTLQELQVSGHRWVAPEDLDGFDLLPADMPMAARLRRELGDADNSCL